MNDTNGANLIPAYEAAITATHARGQLKPGVFERRACLIWMPLVEVPSLKA